MEDFIRSYANFEKTKFNKNISDTELKMSKLLIVIDKQDANKFLKIRDSTKFIQNSSKVNKMKFQMISNNAHRSSKDVQFDK